MYRKLGESLVPCYKDPRSTATCPEAPLGARTAAKARGGYYRISYLGFKLYDDHDREPELNRVTLTMDRTLCEVVFPVQAVQS